VGKEADSCALYCVVIMENISSTQTVLPTQSDVHNA